jgi:nucleoside-diphosphate-sugar epimerase
MKILVTGCRGYIGYPLCIELINNSPHEVIGIDNDSRRRWVEQASYQFRDSSNLGITGDLANRNFVNELLSVYRPKAIIHLASQPSMPYSQINGERALFTQVNNLSMCLNLLWGIKENALDTKFIITTTTGIPGQAYKEIPESPTFNMAGSWYHVSRGFDSANCRLASSQWGINTIELRTSIVYGLQTATMRRLGLETRFDTDFYFGTVLNRFVDKASRGQPIMVYGKGKQTKPFISLEDTVTSIVKAIDYKKQGHNIFNQTTETITILELAEIIKKYTKCEIVHVPNPRKEKETHHMSFDNKKFLKLLGKKPKTIDRGIQEMIVYLEDYGHHYTYFSGSSN